MLAHDPSPEGTDPHSGTSFGTPTHRGLHTGIVLAEVDAAGRSVLEGFIARRFREVYDARVAHFLPRLFGARDVQGRLIAAFGLRSAAEGPLFLEQYLDVPVEIAIETSFGAPASRTAIAEVGNLAGTTSGALRALIPALTRRLADEGFAYVAFTGSSRLCNGFSRLGLPLRSVAGAAVDRLPAAEQSSWGRYYDSGPGVMLGDVSLGARLLEVYARHPQVLRAQLAPLASVGAP
jgi:hypothetical protein